MVWQVNYINADGGVGLTLAGQKGKRLQVRSVLKNPSRDPRTWNPWKDSDSEENIVKISR